MKLISAVLHRALGRTPNGSSITVDYPQDKEVLAAPQYSFRISAGSGMTEIEVSLDGGAWQGCREAGGFWWFDASTLAPGSHQIVAQGKSALGERMVSRRRRFTCRF